MLLARTGCLVGALAIGTPAAAQSSPDPTLLAIERAYYAGEPAAGREALEALGEADDVTRAWALWRVAGMHRIRGVDRQTKRRHERVRKPLLEEAESLMKAWIEADPNDAGAHLVLSQVYQARITGMMSGMRFGRRAGETLDRALELAPDDPRPLYLKGVNQLMAPGPFGNKEEARSNLGRRGALRGGRSRRSLLVGRTGGPGLPRPVIRERERVRRGPRGIRAGAGTGARFRLGP